MSSGWWLESYGHITGNPGAFMGTAREPGSLPLSPTVVAGFVRCFSLCTQRYHGFFALRASGLNSAKRHSAVKYLGTCSQQILISQQSGSRRPLVAFRIFSWEIDMYLCVICCCPVAHLCLSLFITLYMIVFLKNMFIYFSMIWFYIRGIHSPARQL